MRDPRRSGMVLAAALLAAAGCATAASGPGALGSEGAQRNMRLVGAHDLQARSAYQPVVHRHGERQTGFRWIAYVGHHGGTEAVPRPVNALTGAAGSTARPSST